MPILFALLLQVGPFATTPAPSAPPRPPAARRTVEAAPAPSPGMPRGRLQLCLDEAASSPTSAVEDAEEWRDSAQGLARAEALLCLGTAHTRLEQWTEAEQAFTRARADASDSGMRAKLSAMAGNAALAGKAPERALVLLEEAQAEADTGGDLRFAGEVAIDRARALVALKREDDAARALVAARTSSADNPLAWLLSATLSRRQGKLAAAQAQIATAAGLNPRDPEIGLEAGVIAMLAGNEAAARKSWQSAIDTAPSSDAATTARGYLAQLGAPPQSKP